MTEIILAERIPSLINERYFIIWHEVIDELRGTPSRQANFISVWDYRNNTELYMTLLE